MELIGLTMLALGGAAINSSGWWGWIADAMFLAGLVMLYKSERSKQNAKGKN